MEEREAEETKQIFIGPVENIVGVLTTSGGSEFSYGHFRLVLIFLSLCGGWQSNKPVIDVVHQVFTQLVARNLVQVGSILEVAVDVLDVLLVSSASREHRGWVGLSGDCVLELNAFGHSPVHIAANVIEALVSQELSHCGVGSGSFGLFGVNLSLNGGSLGLSEGAVVVVNSKHKVVWLSVHLDWENGGLVWQSI